jgi:hypothetical protein
MFATIYLPDFICKPSCAINPRQKNCGINRRSRKKPGSSNSTSGRTNRCAMRNDTSQGLARCLHLVVKMRKPSQEKPLQEILLHFAGTLAPYVEATGPGISTINLQTKI